MTYKPIQLTAEQIEDFHNQGFLILEEFLDESFAISIADGIEPLFKGQFETGNYPDEWYGRPGLSIENANQQISGMWRCDRTIAGLSLSAEIARLTATLAGWNGGRIATDSSWFKPPGGSEVSFHRNSTYATCIDPSEIMTCWISLSPATVETGTLEFVPASHKWCCSDPVKILLHNPKDDYRQSLQAAAVEAGVERFDIVSAEIPSGGCIFLHWNLWHGSGQNMSPDQTRRSMSVQTFGSDAKFQPSNGSYSHFYSRYRSLGSTTIDESFFPILWTKDGYRSPFLAKYCQDALEAPALVTASVTKD